MKVISSTVLVALFAVSQGRFLDATNPALAVSTTYGSTAFVNTLNCGQCIGLGHTYCVKQAENTIINAYQTGSTNQVCIQSGTSSTQQTDAAWSCSNQFADRVYSKYTCQVNTVACGSVQTFQLANTTSTANFNISGLALGQTCFYKVAATCGGPSFKPNDTSRVEVEFVGFKDADLNSSTVVKAFGSGTSNDTAKRQGTPVAGMPRRDHYFQASLGGNNIANGNTTTNYDVTVNGTVWGRSGRYDKVAGGRRAYGNPTQGDTQLGNLTTQTDLDCQGRNLYLAVTATTDAASLRIDLSSVSFYRPPTDTTTGASFLSMTVAALVGLLSLAFF
jgi:hypothetical protein